MIDDEYNRLSLYLERVHDLIKTAREVVTGPF
jgi:hypothetical protein